MKFGVLVLALAAGALGQFAAARTPTPVVVATPTAMKLCRAYQGDNYEAAKKTYPALQAAISAVQEHGVVPWYTDNTDAVSRAIMLSKLSTCGADTKIPMVVYGIPNKDCDANYSNAGSNEDFDDYKRFITTLTTVFPTQNMVYIVEPDAVGLTANGGCGVANNYSTYLKYALEQLSNNTNAELFLDVGFWTLLPGGQPKAVVKVVNDIWPANGRVNGIALNTANYQTTSDMIALCESFAKATRRSDMKCIIDTSRNNNGPSANGEWCNYKNAGIGMPPTMDTGSPRAAYFLWIKPPGESDGTCEKQTTGDSRIGPKAGAFFKEQFETLWHNGYFVESGITANGHPQFSPSAPTRTSRKPTAATRKPIPTGNPKPTTGEIVPTAKEPTPAPRSPTPAPDEPTPSTGKPPTTVHKATPTPPIQNATPTPEIQKLTSVPTTGTRQAAPTPVLDFQAIQD